jgi:hypothetical protein
LNAGNLLVTPQNAPSVTDFAKRTSTGLGSERCPFRIRHGGPFCNTELVEALLDQRFNHHSIIYFYLNRLPSRRLSFLLNIVAWMSDVFLSASIQNA